MNQIEGNRQKQNNTEHQKRFLNKNLHSHIINFDAMTLVNIERDRHTSKAVDDKACGLWPNRHVPLLKYDMWFTICVPAAQATGYIPLCMEYSYSQCFTFL